MSVLADIPRLYRWVQPEAKKYAVGLTALLGVNVSDVIAPIFMAVAIDLAEASLRHGEPGTPPILKLVGLDSSHFSLLGAIGLYLAFQLLANICRYPMLMKVAVPSHQVGQNLRNRLVDHVLKLSQPFYDRARSGDLMSRATNDINAARMMFGPGVLVGVDAIMIVSLVLVVLFALSWELALIAMIPMPVVAYLTNKLAHAEYNAFEAVQSDLSKLTERARESYAGVRIIQGYAREGHDTERFQAFSWRHLVKNLRLARVQAVRDPTFDLMLGASTVLVVIFGGAQIVRGEMTIGTFLAFLFLVRYLSGPMIGFGWAISLFQRGRASMHRLDKLLAEPVEIVDSPDAQPLSGAGDVEIRELTFAYAARRGQEEDTGPALTEVSLRIPAGTRLGILGPVGSGKSTLARLLVRLYDPPKGTVFVGGRDIRNVTLESLRSEVVLAPQDTFLFSDTVTRNIHLARSGNEIEDRGEGAARAAQLHDEIEELTAAYDTLLGERGVNLSGGQRQRLAMARAIASDPRVLILDDCLSAVDAQTEERILDALDEVFDGRTGIIISHRVIAVQRCEQIAVLDQGRVIECGSHEDLLAAGGYYASIAEKQLAKEAA